MTSLVERAILIFIFAEKQIGNLLAMTFATPNDTPELNALKALFGAPISMGRGERTCGAAASGHLSASVFLNHYQGDRKMNLMETTIVKTSDVTIYIHEENCNAEMDAAVQEVANIIFNIYKRTSEENPEGSKEKGSQ